MGFYRKAFDTDSACTTPRGRSHPRSPEPQLLSVDRQLDVGLLVVLQQVGHPHGFVASAQHALFDAGRLDLTDEALQRLQAAAERCGVAQAGPRQAAAQLRAVALRVRRERRVQPRLVPLRVLIEVCVETWVGQSDLSRPGCARTRCQYLRCITVTVWGGNDAVPERSEVLRDGGVVQRGAADLVRMWSVGQL